MPPGHPIILLKSNWFNMAAVSVKRSRELKQRRFWATYVNRKWGGFSLNISKRYQNFTANWYFSHTEDLAKISVKLLPKDAKRPLRLTCVTQKSLSLPKQEPITRSEQLPCDRVTSFSQTSLFLERFWREFWISFKFHKPVSKTYRCKNDIFAF